MIRLLLVLVLVCALTTHARAETPDRFSVGAGPAFWLDIGAARCYSEGDSYTTCTSAIREWYGGVRSHFDVGVLDWLRVGGELSFGANLDADGNTGLEESWTLRRFLVPMGVHAYAHGQASPGAKAWFGPELLYALRVDRMDTRALFGDEAKVERAARSGLVLGVSLGLDARLAKHIWLGSEIAVGASFVPESKVGFLVTDSVWTAAVRTGLILRYTL